MPLRDCLQLVDNIKNLHLPLNAKLISFDVINLFPSIPTKEIVSTCSGHINKNTSLNINQKKELYSALEVCIKQNYFQFNNKVYSQLDGLPMGSPLSPLLSEIFMASLEDKNFQIKQNFK